jgi:CHAT domain-containing protein
MFQCLFRLENGSGCTSGSIVSTFDSLDTAGIPWLALEARLIKARVLQREGNRTRALRLLEGLVDELVFFRQDLPGVLGSWYWQWREDIYRYYLEVAAVGSDGKQTLVALDRVRLANHLGAAPQPGDQLRELLARREFEADRAPTELAAQANTQWRGRSRAFTPAVSPLDSSGLDRVLAGLAADEIILTYYFSESAVHVLLGGRNGVTMNRLGNFRTLSGQLDRLQQDMNEASDNLVRYLDALGKALLNPVAGSLKPVIYLLPGGPLTGFPFDALRLKGAFLAERHTVINLLSLAGTSISRARFPGDFSERVFLAGNPQTGQDLFSYDVVLSAEVTAVTDAFVGPGLTIVQGVALQKDEFNDPRFAAAGLIHLAVPGTLDLAMPDHSMLLMSKISEEAAADNLRPADIRGLAFESSLVVLSRTGIVRSGQSIFDSRLGFVSDFLLNGARNVVVSLHPGEDSGTAAFMADFYSELVTTQDVSEALSRTRIRAMESTLSKNFMSWAGFQLYIR